MERIDKEKLKRELENERSTIGLGYAATHEWAKQERKDSCRWHFRSAQDALGICVCRLPEVGQQIVAGKEAGVVESVKAASDIYRL
ncbi:MAG: hypothetical protein Ct9H90mP27_3410 [Gammaproteobacteria bacterium]|nr:MAG: hypothetical protein Ct9H90mP27_3410 [Gammaproteobacteria bacterium]